MKRLALLIAVAALLMAPSFGAANPNGVGDGTFDAQCGGACHGDADMNRTSASSLTLDVPSDVYEGLLTSVSVTVSGVQTTSTGVLGVFLLSDVTGADDTPEDDGWTIVSNSEGGTQNYAEVIVAPGVMAYTVEWTLRAPEVGDYELHAAIHHGAQDGSGAPFFGVSEAPTTVQVQPVPADLPRLADDFQPPVLRTLGESTTVRLTTSSVTDLSVEWRVAGGTVQSATVTADVDGTWTFELPASLEPVVVEWRVHLEGVGPTQTTPWLALQSEEPKFTVDETAAYVQSFAVLMVTMVAFMTLQRRVAPATEPPNILPFPDEVMS